MSLEARASDNVLDWIAKDGYSLSEAGWIRAQDHEFYFKVTAEKDGHPTHPASCGAAQPAAANRRRSADALGRLRLAHTVSRPTVTERG